MIGASTRAERQGRRILISMQANPAFRPKGPELGSFSWRLTVLVLCASALVFLPGCGGCRRSAPKTAEELEKELAERQAKLREKRKPDLELDKLRCHPYEPKADRTWCKPGHWTSGTLAAKANNFNLLGELETAVTDSRGNPVGLVGMPYSLESSRLITLAKGQRKTFEPVFFVPANGHPAILSSRITIRKGGRGSVESSLPVSQMPGYQYHFVVLARTPGSYTFLKNLPSVRMPTSQAFSSEEHGYYRVVLLEGARQSPLPSYGLFWTSIAYLLWDDADPDRLTLDQKLALLDWLHWGGQLILSGPDSLDTLRHSFLEPYLPVTAERRRDLTEADLAELNDHWTLANDPSNSPVRPVRPWSGVQLKLHVQADEVPKTGGLLVERRVGRGRIVVSAFRLSERELHNWSGFDGFFNACLLRRPPRTFGVDANGPFVTWEDRSLAQFDPRLVCHLRYFTRDTGRQLQFFQPEEMSYLGYGGGLEIPTSMYSDVASWNDFNTVADEARATLDAAARIKAPHRSFVLWVLGGYLLVLVPLNWAVFRLLGRVEWAWVAAPVIAIVCTVVVIRLARLDIGFARSTTELAVVELQGDYPRAHVTRYDALYTSLTTRYEFRAEDLGTQIQPFPEQGSSSPSPGDSTAVPGFRALAGQGLTRLKYTYGSEVSLDGFTVLSNSAKFVHTEQMIDLDGPISLMRTSRGDTRVVNRTFLTVYGAVVVRKNDQGGVEVAWLGTLKPGQSAPLDFAPGEVKRGQPLWLQQRIRSLRQGSGALPPEVNLLPLLALAEDTAEFSPGQTRLVGWSNEAIGGLEILPVASQVRHAVVVIANLDQGRWPDPKPDANTPDSVPSTSMGRATRTAPWPLGLKPRAAKTVACVIPSNASSFLPRPQHP